MGTLLRCVRCEKEMVLEAYHAGRTVPCPWCRSPNEVPKALDFRTAAVAGRKDETSGSVLLTFAILGLLSSCIFGVGAAVCGVVWWIAQGRIQRARDDGRPVDPLIASARTISVITIVLTAIGVILFVVAR